MCDLPKFESEKLLVGFESSDDAAIYQLNEEQAVIQTLDFFTPIVDDPYLFGQIAAANALSDVYAMGGMPTLALNIVGFPNCLPPEVLKQILKGGADKVKEAGALLVGGHSIEDSEPKYGLSVMGLVHPKKIWANNTVKDQDFLILTKPIGIGVITTAAKEGLVSTETEEAAHQIMATLNKDAALAMLPIKVSACTDVTGFGLLGHALEMVKNTDFAVRLNHKSVPYITEAIGLAEMGIIPAGTYRNEKHIGSNLDISEGVARVYIDLLLDPQTSGGLLLSVPENELDNALQALKNAGTLSCAVIGRIIKKENHHLIVY